jgi:hypothetical protein
LTKKDSYYFTYYQDRKSPQFHFDKDSIEKITRLVPDSLKLNTIQRAQNIVRGRFNFRDIGEVVFTDEVNWHYFHKSNISWHWDFNRHRFFLDLGISYYYTYDDVYLKALTRLWLSWIDQNPPGQGITWKYPFEVASRLNNWIWGFFLLLHSRSDQDYFSQSFMECMLAHADYIYWNLEYHWPNNHLFLQSKVLYQFSLLFPELDNKGLYRKKGQRIFKNQIYTQVLKDGCHSELCSMYHRILAGELLEIYMLMRSNAVDLGIGLSDTIDRMFKFSRAMQRTDGSVPLLGESAGNDSNIRFDPTRFNEVDLNYWIIPQDEIRLWNDKSQQKNKRLYLFETAGYGFLKNEMNGKDLHISFDFGDYSANPASDHGHCDLLSFDLYYDGKPLIMDPGVYYPSADLQFWRSYFKSTRAHNTLMIDNREQIDVRPSSDALKSSKAKLVNCLSSSANTSLTASCIPYWSTDSAVAHHRTIQYDGSYRIVIHDELKGKGTHNCKWHFHLAPNINPSKQNDKTIICFNQNGKYLMKFSFTGNANPTISIIKGGLNPCLGWVSFNSSQVLSAYSMLFEINVKFPFKCQFTIELPP